MSILFARQEIFDLRARVVGYEILYRQHSAEAALLPQGDVLAGDQATSAVVANLFTNIDLDVVLAGHPAYINFTRNNLLQKIPLMLPKERIVIEVLEDMLIDEQLLSLLLTYAKLGYKLALDDFIFHVHLAPLVEAVDIIKIDVLQSSPEDVRRQLAHLAGFKGKLLAEKIESEAQLQWCKQQGFHLFQGYHLNYPACVEGQLLSENKTYLLRIMAELHDPDVSLQQVEAIILQIPKLSYRILRLANSVMYYVGRKMDTLLAAIQQLGLLHIRNWISLLLASSLDDVQPDMLERTLIRAKMCHALARRSEVDPHMAYTVGMLSCLDSILRQPLADILQQLPLQESIIEALLEHKGALGSLLLLVKNYERAKFSELDFTTFSEGDFREAYLIGLQYANEVMMIISRD
ncbi:MAG: HDOD domain-containing protein [Legionellaceae bacterium]|nr:HDOD domain-containing protein [Legionellaceae bacterium]